MGCNPQDKERRAAALSYQSRPLRRMLGDRRSIPRHLSSDLSLATHALAMSMGRGTNRACRRSIDFDCPNRDDRRVQTKSTALAKRGAHMPARISRRGLLDRIATGALAGMAFALPGVGLAQEQRRYGILGKRAPELLVDYWIDADGEPFRFDWASTKGKWVFLKCFQAWCPGCHAHGFPTLKKVADAFAGHDRVAVLGLQTVFEGFGTNTKDKVREMQLRYELAIPMGHDAGERGGLEHPVTMLNYRTGGTPWIIVIDPQGRVIYNDFRIDPGKFIDYLNAQLA